MNADKETRIARAHLLLTSSMLCSRAKGNRFVTLSKAPSLRKKNYYALASPHWTLKELFLLFLALIFILIAIGFFEKLMSYVYFIFAVAIFESSTFVGSSVCVEQMGQSLGILVGTNVWRRYFRNNLPICLQSS